MNENKCPCCGATIDFNATECKYCGEVITVEPPQFQEAQQIQQPVAQGQQYKLMETQATYISDSSSISKKNKNVAGLLAIFLGSFGIHKFYLGKTGMGILYLIFCWTYIPAIVSFFEGIIYLTSSEEKFYRKYVKKR